MAPGEPNRRSDLPLRVAALPGSETRSSNPYQWLLYAHLAEIGVVVESFPPSGPCDIVHVHWPEQTVHHPDAKLAARRSIRRLRDLRAARRRGAAVVWTVHNARGHDQRRPLAERLFWRLFLPLVDGMILLDSGDHPSLRRRLRRLRGRPVAVVPHGHYRDAYPPAPARAPARRELGLDEHVPVVGFVGRIKPYKGVEALITAHRQLPTHVQLVIAGDARDEGYLAALRASAPDAHWLARQLSEDELSTVVGACDLVVLPYRAILNSGSALLALSLDRPVLAPAQGSLPALASTVGSGWLTTYEGDLDGACLSRALDASRSVTGRPDLHAHDWDSIAGQTLELYRRAAAARAVRSGGTGRSRTPT